MFGWHIEPTKLYVNFALQSIGLLNEKFVEFIADEFTDNFVKYQIFWLE